MIKTSILLCTYNEEKYIKNKIFNLKKSITDLEIIIVDDSSTDNTLQIVKGLNQEN